MRLPLALNAAAAMSALILIAIYLHAGEWDGVLIAVALLGALVQAMGLQRSAK